MDQEDCAVILAGGQGSRLKPYTTVLPKPLIPVGDVPILEIVTHQLRGCGFQKLILAVSRRDGLLRSYFGSGEAFGVDFFYSREDRPLGTIGPLHPVVDRLPESFLVMNGDVLTDIDYRQCLDAHKASGCHLTVGVFKRRIQIADGVIEVGSDGRVTSFREKPTRSFWVSMGVYAMNRSVLEFVPRNRPFGMDDVVLAMLGAAAPINTYRHSGEWYDIGCPEDLDRANAAFAKRRARFLHPEHETVGVAAWHDS